MNVCETKQSNQPDPHWDTLACVNAECKDYAQAGLNNLTVRKAYGQDQIRYLRCRTCQQEFSERKGSALWNTKVSEEKAVAVAAHLAEGCSIMNELAHDWRKNMREILEEKRSG